MRIKTSGAQAFNVPNDEEGREFCRLLRKFINRRGWYYWRRSRGSRQEHGVQGRLPLEHSEWMAVYLSDVKRRPRRSRAEAKRLADEELYQTKPAFSFPNDDICFDGKKVIDTRKEAPKLNFDPDPTFTPPEPKVLDLKTHGCGHYNDPNQGAFVNSEWKIVAGGAPMATAETVDEDEIILDPTELRALAVAIDLVDEPDLLCELIGVDAKEAKRIITGLRDKLVD